MSNPQPAFKGLPQQNVMDLAIRLGLVAFLVYLCVVILSPFMGLISWALILAVAVYPLQRLVAGRLGGRQGLSATSLVLGGLLIVGVPSLMLGSSFASFAHDAITSLNSDAHLIKPPSPEVADWPLVGKKLHKVWSLAATDLPVLMERIRPQLVGLTKPVLATAAATAGGVLQFLGSLIVAGIMLAYAQPGGEAMARILNRIAGAERGGKLYTLTTATIRSVAVGVIGIAFIQALLVGIGFILSGIPAAGLLALLALLFGIAQLPVLLITLPVVGYVWMTGDSTTTNLLLTLYLVVAGFADNILKPMLLGRGVDAPMPIILLGALGGMISGGIIGLFLGAVALALGYVLFMDWLGAGQPQAATGAATTRAEPANSN